LRYAWSPALLIAEGHTRRSLVPSPMMTAMERGAICRLEELTRLQPEVSDALISILSEKALAVPELGEVVYAQRGFNVIGTANTRDRGVNEMSAALKRRLNFVHIPIIAEIETEVALVGRRVAQLNAAYQIKAVVPEDLVRTVVTTFAEMRAGKAGSGTKVKQPTTTLSTAEAISVVFQSAILGYHFRSGVPDAETIARAMVGAIAKDDDRDLEVLADYLESHARRRPEESWQEFYVAARRVLRK
jgi:MoxR-like ATPase